jgi:hypothetical protein
VKQHAMDLDGSKAGGSEFRPPSSGYQWNLRAMIN